MRWRLFLAFLLLACLLWGGSRLYFALTDGFAVSNLEPAFIYEAAEPLSALHQLSPEELSLLLSQEFHYLDKGCQAYVFGSSDGRYVLKLIKQQRFRTKPWLDALSYLPWFANYRKERLAHKQAKLFRLLDGWSAAARHLSEEAGIVWVYLGQKRSEQPPLKVVLKDKLGGRHTIDLLSTHFMIQRRVDAMLAPHLEGLIASQQQEAAKQLLNELIAMVVGEYQRGLADHDPALLQNTGVCAGHPIHIDLGQLACQQEARQEAFWKQHLFDKTVQLRDWLRSRSAPLTAHLEEKLFQLLGPSLYTRRPTPSHGS